MGNFIDKTFTVIADILLKILPTSNREKQAFSLKIFNKGSKPVFYAYLTLLT